MVTIALELATRNGSQLNLMDSFEKLQGMRSSGSKGPVFYIFYY